MPSILTMKRFSRSSSIHNKESPVSPPTSYTPPMNNAAPTSHTSAGYDSRPASSTTGSSYEFAGRPPSSHVIPTAAVSNLSRTDQIVLRHFWEAKVEENRGRELHFLRFPHFPQYPSHQDLIPYCEIYHSIKTSPGASIVSLGSANGIYIGFELHQGAQLHIDFDDEWYSIGHFRVNFKPYDHLIQDPAAEATFQSWPKPLTIEFLEQQYQRWCLDLMSPCWEAKEISELGGSTKGGAPTKGSMEENI